MYNQSVELFARAGQSIPGGVNSPVRAFRSVGGTPLFIKRAEGAYLYDEDNNRYIDFINSWGPMIKGHAWQPVIDALKDQLQYSLSFGAPTRLEIEMAELIKSMVPGIDLVRMVNSGTEACMSALRLARGFTGRNKLIKFEGCYHGHADSFLVDAGSGVATLSIQKVPGVTSAIANDSITVPYNDIEAVKSAVAAYKGEIAAIIVEPVAGNMGCIIPAADFLQSLRTICTEEGIVYILDEVMTGFRLAPGGAQEKCQVEADLVTFGKIIGGGLPVGAFGGKKHIMEHIAPLGKVYQAGTLSGNPLAMRAGYCMLNALKSDPAIYQRLEDKTRYLATGLKEIFMASAIPVQVNQLGSMMSVHFSEEPVTDFASAKKADVQRFSRYFHHSLNDGIYLPPSAFESWFISDALSDADIEHTLQSASRFAMEKKA
jgi:glutamate-1-semialdehyde 2,1-aminomutase